jgi:hypothetical protein
MVEGENSSMIYSIYYKNLCKYHNVPPPSTTIKGKKKEKSQCTKISVSIQKQWINWEINQEKKPHSK